MRRPLAAFFLGPGGDTQQALNRIVDLFANHVADEGDEVRGMRVLRVPGWAGYFTILGRPSTVRSTRRAYCAKNALPASACGPRYLDGRVVPPQAHEPELHWPMTREDALGVLGLISFLFRKLEKALVVRGGGGGLPVTL